MARTAAGELVGRVFAGRYRLFAPIGVGASATVYLADDTRLARRVAVKVLHESRTGDATFLRRFRVEARAAAQLTHPNVVIVHDWYDASEADPNVPVDPPYLVTELCEGGSLRSLLDEGYRCTPSQSLRLGLEAARGLAYAHARGYMHRDVKPANLLLGADGRVRIGDFGLARALAEASDTLPSGALLGTARYAAPEQALGALLDGRADVYALALVIVELLTGEVPFAGDTPLGTLMARTQTPLSLPGGVGALGPVIAAAGTIDSADRIDAAQLVQLLEAAARTLPRPTPLPVRLIGALDVMAAQSGAQRDKTAVAPLGPAAEQATVVVGDPSPSNAAASANTGRGDASPPVATDVAMTTAVTVDATTAGDAYLGLDALLERQQTDRAGAGLAADKLAAAASEGAKSEGAKSEGAKSAKSEGAKSEGAKSEGAKSAESAGTDVSKRAELSDESLAPVRLKPRRRWRRRLALVAGLSLVGAGAAYAIDRGIGFTATSEVPTVVGLSYDNAASLITTSRLTPTVDVRRFDEAHPVGEVLSQTPLGGLRVAEGTEVALVVSQGPAPRPVPELVGLSLDEARRRLVDIGLQLAADVSKRPDEVVPAGVVLEAAPASGTLPVGGEVQVVLSSGPAPRVVPNLSGSDPDVARQTLLDLGLEPVVEEEFSETVPKGIVIAGSYRPTSEVPKGTRVRIRVSRGPELIKIPQTRGLTVLQATSRLQAAGLSVGGVEGDPTEAVQRSVPGAGIAIRRGASVRLVTKAATSTGPSGTSTGPSGSSAPNESSPATLAPAVSAGSVGATSTT